ncbi:Histidine kinase-, DNA gyrase B-, and HSP90-like ATPase [Carpediemonas membranifera]|uniref:Histidine kinase-, DNA gyrase B-, and HSP90-like ATPase n=1 Tax=Carpediemonas membranifera TaxID=201153 RepID=A0A8J6AYB9_9EUKA|nr:Histidine kinase-, DNA gyrase B-, and HSP90-like ATPase [Carpediemonas membranifera]|eukprot:KAG9394455.1 Histidine kinase-, DNA gyrase B-, and HSP90-like ATPase [Carpediemonas membranifera]
MPVDIEDSVARNGKSRMPKALTATLFVADDKVVHPLQRINPNSMKTIDTVSFEDIFELSLFQEVVDALSAASRITSQMLTPSGDEGITDRPSNLPVLFKRIWDRIQFTAEAAEQTLGPWVVAMSQRAGLHGAEVTIHLSRRVLAVWVVCGVRLPDSPLPPFIRDLCLTHGIDGAAAEGLWAAMPVMTAEQFADKVGFVRLFATQMSTLASRSFASRVSVVSLREKNRFLSERTVFLESLIQQRGKDLIQANQQLSASLATRRLFLSRVSHDMRGPLLGVVGTAQLLEDDVQTQILSDVERRSSLKIMRSSVEILLSFVDSLLDFSTLVSADDSRPLVTLEEKPVDLRAFTPSVVSLFHAVMVQKELAVSINISNSVPSAIMIDPVRLAQLMTNFMGNGVKFSQPGGRIEVHVDRIDPGSLPPCMPEGAYAIIASPTLYSTQTLPSDEEPMVTLHCLAELKGTLPATDDATALISIVVADTGPGINPAQLYDIFSAFAQQEIWTSRVYGGSGLGLSMCRSVCVDMYGGVIAATNRPDGGALFAAFLPMKLTDETPVDPFKEMPSSHPLFKHKARSRNPLLSPHLDPVPHEVPQDSPDFMDPSQIRILVVDDLDVNRVIVGRLLKMALRRTGRPYSISYACGGYECLQLTEKNTYDIILLDLHMPDLDGTEVVRQIRARERDQPGDLGHQPVLALSASDPQVLAELCTEEGFDGFLQKPFKQAELDSILHKFGGSTNSLS